MMTPTQIYDGFWDRALYVEPYVRYFVWDFLRFPRYLDNDEYGHTQVSPSFWGGR